MAKDTNKAGTAGANAGDSGADDGAGDDAEQPDTARDGQDEAGEGDSGSGGADETPAALKARLQRLESQNKKLSKENADRRHAQKKADELLKGFKKLLGADEGDEGDEKVRGVVEKGNAKLRGILLKSEVVAAAMKAGAKNPSTVARLIDLSDVEVDIDKESVDADAISEKLAALKADEPYLFGAAAGAAGGKGGSEDDPGAAGGGNKSLLRKFQEMSRSGDKYAAAEFYTQNRDAIEKERRARR